MIVGTHGISKSRFLLDSPHINPNTNTNTNINTLCCSQNHESKVPKLSSFTRTKFERGLKDPPLILKSQNQLADYCTVLEGEPSYSCWQAYFELQLLQAEYSKAELERLIIEAGGVKSLIGCVHGIAAIHKANKRASDTHIMTSQQQQQQQDAPVHMHIPDGLPKTTQEIEEEEKARMPDSDYTRLLRVRGTHPAWYSPTPDHQSD